MLGVLPVLSSVQLVKNYMSAMLYKIFCFELMHGLSIDVSKMLKRSLRNMVAGSFRTAGFMLHRQNINKIFKQFKRQELHWLIFFMKETETGSNGFGLLRAFPKRNDLIGKTSLFSETRLGGARVLRLQLCGSSLTFFRDYGCILWKD